MITWTAVDFATALTVVTGSIGVWLGIYLHDHPRRFLADAAIVLLTAGGLFAAFGYSWFLYINDGSLKMLFTVELLTILAYLLHLIVLVIASLCQGVYFWGRHRIRRWRRTRRMWK